MDRQQRTVWFLITLTLFNGIVPTSLFADGWSFGTTTIDEVAKRVDQLQKKIDDHGVIVAKKPDVWGESRLLRHREEFEAQMKAELTRFRSTLQATESTRDVAFLASALAVSNNVAAPTVSDPNNTSQNSQTINVDVASLLPGNNDLNSATSRIIPRSDKFGTNIETKFVGPDADGKVGEIAGISLEPVTFLNQKKRYLEHLNALRRLNEGDDVGDSPGYALNLLRIPVSILPGRETRKGYGAEISITVDPYESEELLPEVFRNFVVNGVVDRVSPTVMRLVSDMKYEDSYENTLNMWRIYQYSIILRELNTQSNAQNNSRLLRGNERLVNKIVAEVESIIKSFDKDKLTEAARLSIQAIETVLDSSTQAAELLADLEAINADRLNPEQLQPQEWTLVQPKVQELYKQIAKFKESGLLDSRYRSDDILGYKDVFDADKIEDAQEKYKDIYNRKSEGFSEITRPKEGLSLWDFEYLIGEYAASEIISETLPQLLNELFQSYRQGVFEPFSAGNGSQLKQAVPISHNSDVDGTSLIPVALTLYRVLRPEEKQFNYEDVRRFLRQEIAAAYEMLSQNIVEHGQILSTQESPRRREYSDIMEFWRAHCSQDLVNAVKSVRRKGDDALENYFYHRRFLLFEEEVGALDTSSGQPNSVNQHHGLEQLTLSDHRGYYYSDLKEHFPEADFSPTAYLGWHVILESVLLNDRLKQDMREIKVEKGCPCLNHEGLDFYGPSPSLEARHAFNEYVRCRWPVKVFALDPVTDEQNVGAAFSQRRELQMALAIGFSQGLFSAQNLDRYIRRLEYDLETIELNRTSVGFAFGEDTFGWRFYPRVQTPSVPGNFETKFRDLLVGGRDREHALKDRMLEAGMRECTALVVMPSFIPYMNVDIQTNYFKIGKGFFHKPFGRKNDLSDAVTLSRELTEVRNLVYQCVEDQHLYRPEEIAHLQRAINRIDHQLPLQCEMVQVPYENTLSGFEAFNSGISDLGPQLLDWYGAPGILVATGSELPPKSTSNVTSEDTTVDKLKITTTDNTTISDPDPLGPTQVFLIGKNFTSLGEGTRVIAGGMDVTDSKKVVNRDIISVLIPSSVMTSEVKIEADDDPKFYVDVHLATPHGVTSRIRVPAIEPRTAKKANVRLATVTKKVEEIEKKVDAVDARQITKVTWADKKNDGSLKTYLDANSTPQYLVSVEKNSELKVPVCAFNSDVENIDVAFQVEVSTDEKEFKLLTDKNKKPFYIPFPNSIPVKPDANEIPTAAIDNTQLEWLIEKVLQKSNYRRDDVKAIRIHGCIRLRNDELLFKFAEWPVYKIDDYLEIKLASIDACVACKNVNCTCQKSTANMPLSSIWSNQDDERLKTNPLIKAALKKTVHQNDRIALPLLPTLSK